MAGKVRHLILRGGRYHARMVVPSKLRSVVGKVEISAPLGADRRLALRKLPAAVANMQDRLDTARAKLKQQSSAPSKHGRPRLLDSTEMGRIHFAQAVASDTEFRNADPRYATGFVDEDRVRHLREIIAGRASNLEIGATIGIVIEYFRRRRNHALVEGSPEWRALARVLAEAELESLRITAARDEGDTDPAAPAFLDASTATGATIEQTSARVGEVFDGYRSELQGAGKAKNAETRWSPVVDSLISFLGHDRSERITRRDVIRWKDHLLKTFAPKTVRDSYLATARSAFGWALDNEQVPANPFSGVKVIVAKAKLGREKGFNDDEALAVVKAARGYTPASAREQAPMIAAKRWTPLLAAYSGARIGEVAQLRVEDVQRHGAIDFMRITPEAGTVKSGVFRDVPLHPHLIDLGFLVFAASVKAGPLFYREGNRKGKGNPASMVADRVGKWIRSLEVAAASVQPNHGWRHRLKTQGRELGVDGRVLDAIQGHAPRTAGESYGDVTLKAKSAVIGQFPRYDVT